MRLLSIKANSPLARREHILPKTEDCVSPAGAETLKTFPKTGIEELGRAEPTIMEQSCLAEGDGAWPLCSLRALLFSQPCCIYVKLLALNRGFLLVFELEARTIV